MDLTYPAILFAGGLAAGLYASTVGGGTFVSFPLLLFTGMSTAAAIATNRFALIFLQISGCAKFHRTGHLDAKSAIPLGIIAAIGSLIGANIVVSVSEAVLNMVVAVLLVGAFIFIMQEKRLEKTKWLRLHPVLVYLIIFMLGIYGGFFGASVATFLMVVFIILGNSFIKSAAMSRVINLFLSVTAAAFFIWKGLVNYTYAIALAAGFIIGGWIGVGISVKKGDNYVRALLMLIIIFSVIKLIWDIFF